MKTIIIKNNLGYDEEIIDLRSFNVTASGIVTLSDFFTALEMSNSSDLIAKVADATFTVNNGMEDLLPLVGIKYCLGELIEVGLHDEFRDRSGKLRFHQTSRKLGTMILWTGEGDDSSNPTIVGGGEPFSFVYRQGQYEPLVKYIDFNCVETETWVHEGYVTWKDCFLDTLDLQVVPRVTSIAASNGTDYALYGGYLVVPAPPGYGDIEITSDITTHSGGLVCMTNDDLDTPPIAYWNADWNIATKRYDNITAAPEGDGRYNMFAIEVPFATFVRRMPLLNSGFIALNSSDTDEIGHGMRLKMTADTNTTMSGIGDHDWSVAVTMCMHRSRSV